MARESLHKRETGENRRKRLAESWERAVAQHEAAVSRLDEPKLRTSTRWLGRTKGTPYSRVKIVKVEPAHKGRPAVFHYNHPTRASRRYAVPATRENLSNFISGDLPFHMVSELTGAFSRD